MLIQSKQIKKILAARIRVSGFSASGVDDVVTSALTTALTTAGYNGGSVTLQPTTTETTSGVITGANNTVLLYNGTTKEPLTDASLNEVYGRMTESGGVYTLAYYSLVNGVETSYSLASTTIDFEFPYRFEFKDLPTDAIISQKARNISDDPQGGSTFYDSQILTITATNTVTAFTPPASTVDDAIFYVNGQAIFNGQGISTNASGTVTVTAGTLGYSLETTDILTVSYTYTL